MQLWMWIQLSRFHNLRAVIPDQARMTVLDDMPHHSMLEFPNFNDNLLGVYPHE